MSILLVFSGLVWFCIAKINGFNMQDIFQFMRPIPTVVTVDIILYGLFVKWGWRLKFLQKWLVPFPDLNGTWEGWLQTNWKDPKGGKTPDRIPIILTIKQSFTHISCVMRTGEMESHSYVEGFCIDEDVQVRRLCYSYTSRPKNTVRDRSTPHDGTMRFNIIERPALKLQGEYWTQRGTSGTVKLKFLIKDQLDELPADFPEHPMNAKNG